MKATLQVLSNDERARIHERTLHVLSTAGERVDTAEGRRILSEAGAHVDDATRIVRFPPEVVEEALRLAPKSFSLGGRRPGWEFPLNAGQSTLVVGGQATMMLDHATSERRPSTHRDWLEITRVIDAVDEIGVYWTMVEGAETGHSRADWIDYNVDMLRGFSRHIQDAVFAPEDAPWLLEVLEIVFGSREAVRCAHPYSLLMTPVSPLVIEGPATDAWLALRGWDIPVAVLPMPMMGATAPGTMLATTLQANCEVLGMLCLIQAAEPGTPFIYAPAPVTMDPRSGRYASNSAHPAMSAATTEMARYYGLPAQGNGFSAHYFAPGIKSTYERSMAALLGTLAWPDIMLGPGLLGGALVFSPEQMLIDLEIYRMAVKDHEGIPAADGLWLDDVLERVGPGGHFVAERSTRENARSGEWFLSSLGLHDSAEAWAEAGRPDLLDEARAEFERIRATHDPLPLGEDAERELRKLRRRAADALEATA